MRIEETSAHPETGAGRRDRAAPAAGRSRELGDELGRADVGEDLAAQMGSVDAAVSSATRQRKPTVRMNSRSKVASIMVGEESATSAPT